MIRIKRRALSAKASEPKTITTENGDVIKKARKPTRWKPGTEALRDIKYLQRKYHGNLIPKSVIGRLVREHVGSNFFLSRTALHIIHSELEEMAVEMFNKAGHIAYTHNKFTVLPKHLKLVFMSQMNRTLNSPLEYTKAIEA